MSKEADERYEEFWKEIVENPDGTLNLDAIKAELHDYWFLLEQVPQVYMHITGDMLSKPNYYASAVIQVADEYTQRLIDEAFEDEGIER